MFSSSLLLAFDSQKLNELSRCALHKTIGGGDGEKVFCKTDKVPHQCSVVVGGQEREYLGEGEKPGLCNDNIETNDDRNSYDNNNNNNSENCDKNNNINRNENNNNNNNENFNNNNSNNNENFYSSCTVDNHVPYNVKMIDFGHAFIDLEGTEGEPDNNYLFGMYNLLAYFQQLLTDA